MSWVLLAAAPSKHMDNASSNSHSIDHSLPSYISLLIIRKAIRYMDGSALNPAEAWGFAQ
jgi:hypothetical protein